MHLIFFSSPKAPEKKKKKKTKAVENSHRNLENLVSDQRWFSIPNLVLFSPYNNLDRFENFPFNIQYRWPDCFSEFPCHHHPTLRLFFCISSVSSHIGTIFRLIYDPSWVRRKSLTWSFVVSFGFALHTSCPKRYTAPQVEAFGSCFPPPSGTIDCRCLAAGNARTEWPQWWPDSGHRCGGDDPHVLDWLPNWTG